MPVSCGTGEALDPYLKGNEILLHGHRRMDLHESSLVDVLNSLSISMEADVWYEKISMAYETILVVYRTAKRSYDLRVVHSAKSQLQNTELSCPCVVRCGAEPTISSTAGAP
jgi:hypothetical protein